MIAVDTNVLVHAHRTESAFHQRARDLVKGLAEGSGPWAIPWPCAHEFLAVVTHPRIFTPPTPLTKALAQLRSWVGSPVVQLIGELPNHLETLADLLENAKVVGPKVHDARIAALCIAHGVTELWTLDRDFLGILRCPPTIHWRRGVPSSSACPRRSSRLDNVARLSVATRHFGHGDRQCLG